eukprot:scaffold4255_cov54-Phaeocystis_antarctica.AAC.1
MQRASKARRILAGDDLEVGLAKTPVQGKAQTCEGQIPDKCVFQSRHVGKRLVWVRARLGIPIFLVNCWQTSGTRPPVYLVGVGARGRARALTTLARALTTLARALTTLARALTTLARALTALARALTTLARALTTLARALTLRYAPQGVTLVHPVVDQLPVLGHVLLGVGVGVRVGSKVRDRATTGTLARTCGHLRGAQARVVLGARAGARFRAS